MKKKVYITLFFSLVISFFSIMNVKAIEVTPVFKGGGYDTGIRWHAHGKNASGPHGVYTDHVKAVKINGIEYPIFCTDPGLKLNSGTKYTCSPIQDAGLAYLLDQANGSLNNQPQYSKIQLAIRFYAAMFNNLFSGEIVNMKAAVIRYIQIDVTHRGESMLEGCPECKAAGAVNASDYLEGNEGLINEAISLVHEAYAARKSGNSASGSTMEGTLLFKKIKDEKNEIVYNITSTAKIDKVKFVCEGCTISGADDAGWNGNSGTLTVIPGDPTNCKEFKIKAYFPPNGYYLCTSPGIDNQFLVTKFEEQPATSGVAGGTGEIDTSGEPSQIWRDKPAGCEEDCCTLNPIEPNWMDGNIHNCCYEGTESWAKEYDLNDLFCKYEKNPLVVDHYWAKCKTETYIDEKMTGNLNDYCKIYCTERVLVELPGAITATSGRYFKLTNNSKGKPSPYVEGAKRCRTIIDYDKWHKDYLTIVKKEIEQYHLFQYNKANELAYSQAIDGKEAKTLDINISCSWTHTGNTSCNYTGTCTDPTTNTSTSCQQTDNPSFSEPYAAPTPYSATLNYYYYSKYNSPKTYTFYHKVKIDDTLEKEPNIHKAVKIKYDKKEEFNISPLNWSATKGVDPKTQSPWTGGETYYNTWNNKTETRTYTGQCSISITWKLVCNSMPAFTTKDVYELRDNHKVAADNAQNAYNSATETAENLEKDINKCDYYFDKERHNGYGTYEGLNKEENYKFEPNFGGMEYTQVYLNDYGSLLEEKNQILFNGGCQIYGPELPEKPEGLSDYDDALIEHQYSTNARFGAGEEEMEDFKKLPLAWQETTTGFEQYRHEIYKANKKFTQDARYIAKCEWNEPDNTKYTLVPSGEVTVGTSNVTLNDRQYYVYLTTLDGTYDTRWLLSRLGTNGKFDSFFAENGQTCSTRQNPHDDGLFHCGLHIEHEIVYTGKCNGERTTVSKEECDPIDGTELFLNFKIVDPKNLFPSPRCDGEKCHGYNWYEGTNGEATRNAIERDGAMDTTYSPQHRSYSVTLTPGDMRQIKNYNSYRENDGRGGYSDFSLTCSCPDQPEGCNAPKDDDGNQTCKRSKSCVKCTSVFLTNLYQGRVVYGGSSHEVTAANGNIQTIRDTRAHWSGI